MTSCRGLQGTAAAPGLHTQDRPAAPAQQTAIPAHWLPLLQLQQAAALLLLLACACLLLPQMLLQLGFWEV
jgi:hypothetical protein